MKEGWGRKEETMRGLKKGGMEEKREGKQWRKVGDGKETGEEEVRSEREREGSRK